MTKTDDPPPTPDRLPAAAAAGGPPAQPAAMSAFLEAAFRDAPVVVYAKDTALRFVMSNHRHADLLGLQPDDVIGRTDAQLFGDEAAAVDAISASVLSSGLPAVSEFPLTLPEGERVFHETIFRLRSSMGGTLGLAGIATDITERRRLEDQLAQRNVELREALTELKRTQAILVEQEKLASLGSLVAGLSHEINTPLGVAVLATTMVSDTLGELTERMAAAVQLDPLSRSMLDQIRESAELATANVVRAVTLTRSFRDMAADREIVELRRCMLAQWLTEAVATLQPLGQRHSVQLRHLCTSDRELLLPSGALHQILSNLVANACLHAFDPASTSRIVEVSVVDDGDTVTLLVDDNGRGVPQANRSHIFEPFYTTRRGQGGTGLGLSVSYQLATATLSGTLTVATSPMGGAQFALRWTPTRD